MGWAVACVIWLGDQESMERRRTTRRQLSLSSKSHYEVLDNYYASGLALSPSSEAHRVGEAFDD